MIRILEIELSLEVEPQEGAIRNETRNRYTKHSIQ